MGTGSGTALREGPASGSGAGSLAARSLPRHKARFPRLLGFGWDPSLGKLGWGKLGL